MKYLLVFTLGFLYHTTLLEIANFRRYKGFVDCVNESNYPKSCHHKLNFTMVEGILLYQPDLWELYKGR